jgi:nucleoside-diphosphate-sugar epimerase
MKILVTGSAGHLGEALFRTLADQERYVAGLDIIAGRFTTHLGSIADRATVRKAMDGVEIVFHTATLHKPHVGTHDRQAFIDTNISGTLNLLEEAVAVGVRAFVFTSTTSVFGDALIPPPGDPAAWITEEVRSMPKNIYGVTKSAAEDLCQLAHRNQGLSCIVLRTSRFFPEEDDNAAVRAAYADDNAKLNEYLYRRVDLEDVVSAHLLAASLAPSLGFRRYIISATTPFSPEDAGELRSDAPRVVGRHVPEYAEEYRRRGWSMVPSIDRVYVNERARRELGWQPRYDFRVLIDRLRSDQDMRSPLARRVGAKGYHPNSFLQGPYPVE